jgi:chaperonin GroES
MSVTTLEQCTAKSIQPLSDRILVKRAREEEKSKGGIVIPDTAKEKPAKGTIFKVGPGKHLKSGKIQPMTLKEGDIVLFGKYAGTEIKLDGEDFLIMREEDILAVCEEK